MDFFRTPSVKSVTSVTNDKGDNEMVPGAVIRSPGNCLTTERNPRKLQLGVRMMKGLFDQSCLKLGPFPPNEVGRSVQYIRKRVETKEGRDRT